MNDIIYRKQKEAQRNSKIAIAADSVQLFQAIDHFQLLNCLFVHFVW